MGQIVYSPNTYAGEAYAEKVFPALVPPDGIVEMGLVTPLPGVKARQVLRTIDQDIEFQDPSCDFVKQDPDNVDVAEKYIDPVHYEVMREICYKDIKTSWDVMKLKKGTLNDYVPPADEESALIENMNQKIAIMNEQLYILGKAGVSAGSASFAASYPGLMGRFRADSSITKVKTEDAGSANVSKLALTGITTAAPGVVTVASTAALRTGDRVTLIGTDGNQQVGGVTIENMTFTITVLSATTFSLNATTTGATPATTGKVVFINQTNVVEILSMFYNFMPDNIRYKDDFKIPVSAEVARAYSIAQAAVGTAGGSYFLGKKEMDFLGEKLVPMKYLPAGTIGAWAASNVFFGFDDGSDDVNLLVVDLSKTTGDQKYRYKLGMKSDINHLYGNEIYLITPKTT